MCKFREVPSGKGFPSRDPLSRTLLPFVQPIPTPHTHTCPRPLQFSRSQLVLGTCEAHPKNQWPFFFCPNHFDWRHKERAWFTLTDLGFFIDLQMVDTHRMAGTLLLSGSQYLKAVHLLHHWLQRPCHTKKKTTISNELQRIYVITHFQHCAKTWDKSREPIFSSCYPMFLFFHPRFSGREKGMRNHDEAEHLAKQIQSIIRGNYALTATICVAATIFF